MIILGNKIRNIIITFTFTRGNKALHIMELEVIRWEIASYLQLCQGVQLSASNFNLLSHRIRSYIVMHRYPQEVNTTDSMRGFYIPSTCISSPRLSESVTISSHHSATVLSIVTKASLAVGTIAGACNLEGAILAATSLDAILPDGMGGSTLEVLKLPAPVELDEAWEALGEDQPEDNMES